MLWEIKEEKKLTRQKAQIGTIFVQATSRALMRGIVLLLLFTHQFAWAAWAGIICSHSDKSEHACCRTAQHGSPAVDAHQEVSDAHSSSQCTGKEMPALDAEHTNLPQEVMVCCLPAEEAEAQMAAPSSTERLSVENAATPIRIGAQTINAPTSIYFRPFHHKRPLFLAFSCWLI